MLFWGGFLSHIVCASSYYLQALVLTVFLDHRL